MVTTQQAYDATIFQKQKERRQHQKSAGLHAQASDLPRFSQPIVAGVSRFLTRPGKLCRRNGQQKVAEVEPDLHSRRARPIDIERLHELPDQNVVQIVWNRPQEEQHRDHEERQPPPRGNQPQGISVSLLSQ